MADPAASHLHQTHVLEISATGKIEDRRSQQKAPADQDPGKVWFFTAPQYSLRLPQHSPHTFEPGTCTTPTGGMQHSRTECVGRVSTHIESRQNHGDLLTTLS